MFHVADEEPPPCTKCNGTGRVGLLGAKGMGLFNHGCPECHGTGEESPDAAHSPKHSPKRGHGVSREAHSHHDDSLLKARDASGDLDSETGLLEKVQKEFGVARVERSETRARVDNFLDSIAQANDTEQSPAMQKAMAWFLRYGLKPFLWILDLYIKLCLKLYALYRVLPKNVLSMIFGCALCFFGGTYFMSIAAIEAARNFGGKRILDDIAVLYEQGQVAAKASAEDDLVDADHDGVADVKQMEDKELLEHKARVWMTAVQEPDRTVSTLQSLFTVWIAVIATLKYEFAQTVSLCLAIAEMLDYTVVRVFGPALALAMGKDLKHWVHPCITIIMKVIAVIIACWVQQIISSFYSGLRGGRMFAIGLFSLLSEKQILQQAPDWLVTKPFDPDKSRLDEALQYPLAAIGFWYQWKTGYSLQFPLNLIFLPLTIIEWILRFTVYLG